MYLKNFTQRGGTEEVGSLPYSSLKANQLGTLSLLSEKHYTKPHVSEDIKHSGMSMDNEYKCKVPGFIARKGGLSGL